MSINLNENVVNEAPERENRKDDIFDINNLASMQVGLASPETIRSWGRGEVKRAETINYRSQKPEPDGLFCEKIFGPAKDYECHCGKYKKVRYQGITCEKCGVEVISKEFRRERMGYIELTSPCCHIWYLKSIPSRISLVLEIPPKQLEDIIYFAAHIVLNPGKSTKLSYKQYLNESVARTTFADALTEILSGIEDKESPQALRCNELIEKCGNTDEPLDFFSCADYITLMTGAEFGEGAEAIQKLLHEVDLDAEFAKISAEMSECKSDQGKLQIGKKLDAINAFRDSKQKPEWMILNVIPVIPPDLRPMLQLDGGRFAASDLNDLYRRVIHRNNRLKKLIDMSAPYVIMMNEKRMLQEAVDALIDNGRRGKAVTGPTGRALKSLSSGLKGKQGRFRQNLLGKRVDYSGRSVIAVGPDLRMYQCGLPREMAIQLLRPFIASILIREKYVSAHKAADKIIDRYDPIVFDIVERIISDHPVLLNRAPTLHRLGIQAFQPKLVEGRAIRLHPLVCTGFNADFDGDQMAVHVPLSKAAQKEAVELMLASNNILGPKDGEAIVVPGQDMILGNYHLTTEETSKDFLDRANDLKKLLDLHKTTKVGEMEYRDLGEMIESNLKWAKVEGKVFRSVNEVRTAYESGAVSLHSRIVIKATDIHKEFGAVDSEGNVVAGLPESVKGKYLVTSVGKILFNEVFPDTFPFINDEPTFKAKVIESWFISPDDVASFASSDASVSPLAKLLEKQPLHKAIGKKQLKPLINMIFGKYGAVKTSAVLDKIKDQGFKYSMVSAVTVAISDINDVAGKANEVASGEEAVAKIETLYKKGYLTAAERHKKIVKIWKDSTDHVANFVKEQMKQEKRNPLVIMADSGSRGSVDNFKQLIGMKGLVANPKNEEIELPIVSSYRTGLKVSEFFINTHGARKGGADTALKTADSGYLTRRLVDVSQDVIVREEDCHCDHGFKVRKIVDVARKGEVVCTLASRLVGRFSMFDVTNPETGEVIIPANTLISEAQANAVEAAGIEEVEIRSIFSCKTRDGICQHCYGTSMATGKLVEVGEAVGIMAAQSIGEPGTQLTMRVFHTGGMAGGDITTGLPRVQELVEARNPKGEALISTIAGVVEKIEVKERNSIITIKGDKETVELETPYGSHNRVSKGDVVEAGAKLTEGAINPRDLLTYGGVEKLEVYLIKEIHKVYAAQGIGISDKHLEIIIRQMLRRVTVIDGGDTGLIKGARVSVEKFTALNKETLLSGKRPAICRPLVLGITKAALETDSFLSAASFQETTRVLTDAAIKAKTDPLHGLKENVIVGKLIPAGTGFKPATEEELADWTVAGAMKKVREQYIEKHDRPESED